MVYYVNTSRDPFYNQAFEEYLFRNAPEDDVLLLWRSRPAVVCGSYQNLFAEAHLPTARARGVAVVRRETGGGAVYHDLGNVNYTRICRCEDGHADYERFILPVVDALRRLGINARMNRTCDIAIGDEKFPAARRRSQMDACCTTGRCCTQPISRRCAHLQTARAAITARRASRPYRSR